MFFFLSLAAGIREVPRFYADTDPDVKKDTQFRYHNRYDVAAIRDPKIKLPIIYIPPACEENCCKITIETSPAGDAAQGYRIYIKPKYIAEMALKVISECTHAGC